MGVALPAGLSPSSVSASEPPSPAASKGTLVHRALQLLMGRSPADRTIDAALADLDRARAEMASHADLTGLDLSDGEWHQFHADAEALVRRYFELEDPRTVHPIGLELKLTVQLDGVTLRGVIDRLDLVDGDLVVTDYKTGSVPDEMHENVRLAGVHFYALLCERMLGRRPARVQLYFLSKPEAIIATPTSQSVSGIERRTGAVWNAVVRACERDDFRARPGPLCQYCTFKPYCPAHGGDPAEAAELRGPGAVVEPALPLATV
jgi:putative RecB family exonuclease